MSDAPKGNGFSLVEIIAAIMILSFGLLAMAASTGYVYNQLRSTTFDTQRLLAKQSVVEELRGMFWDSVTTRATAKTVGRYSIRWNVSTLQTGLKGVTIITSGPAYRSRSRSTVVDTMTVEIVSPQ